jgi:hypothetical protein
MKLQEGSEIENIRKKRQFTVQIEMAVQRHAGSITPGKKNSDTHRIGDRTGSTVYLGALKNLR